MSDGVWRRWKTPLMVGRRQDDPGQPLGPDRNWYIPNLQDDHAPVSLGVDPSPRIDTERDDAGIDSLSKAPPHRVDRRVSIDADPSPRFTNDVELDPASAHMVGLRNGRRVSIEADDQAAFANPDPQRGMQSDVQRLSPDFLDRVDAPPEQQSVAGVDTDAQRLSPGFLGLESPTKMSQRPRLASTTAVIIVHYFFLTCR